MEITWENKPISSSRDHYRHPSFSSTLLDQIYRSIDDSPPSTRKKKSREISPNKHRRSIAGDFERSRRTDSVFLRYSSSDSSESKSSVSPRQPKPIRTSVDQKPNNKQELGGFLRTKSKALKIYTDLKKAKQPISPGGRLATFLNSLFTNVAANPKKSKKTTSTTATEPPPQSVISSTTTTTCSSASSFSRSCLSKTPSSSGKSKRSVRFCPVNVILDEEYSSSVVHMAKRDRHIMEEEDNRRVIEAAKELLRTYQKDHVVNVNEEEDDDAASYASSDLFELENLSAIGIDRYREELPVYETTRLDNTNRAVAA